jgi:branched-chain amino acid transport system substrate-binding protein
MGRPHDAKRRRQGYLAISAVSLAAVLAVSACSGTASSSSGSGSSTSVAPIKIGLSVELTGNTAPFGVPAAEAIQLTVNAINAAGGIKELGGAKLQLDEADNMSDPTTAGQQLRQEAADGVVAFLGPMSSSSDSANKSLIEQLKVPLFAPSLTDAVTDDNTNGYIFRTVLPASGWTPAAITYLKQLETSKNTPIKRIGIVGTTVSPGPEVVGAWEAAAKANGWAPTVVTYDPSATTNYAPQIAKLKAADVQVVVGLQLADATPFAQAAKAAGYQPSYGWLWIAGGQYTNSFKSSLGSYVNNWLVMSYTGAVNTSQFPPAVRQIAQAFQAKEGQPLNGLYAAAASGVALIADAVAKAKSRNPQQVAAAARTLNFTNASQSEYPYYMMPGGVKFDSSQSNTNWPAPIIQLAGTNDQIIVYPNQYSTGSVVWPLPSPAS